MSGCSDVFAPQPEVEASHGKFSVLNGGKLVLEDRPPHPGPFTSTLSCSLTNHKEKESAGRQGIIVYVGEVLSSRSTCFEVSFCVCVKIPGNIRILFFFFFFFLGSSISPLHLAAPSSGVGIVGNEHSSFSAREPSRKQTWKTDSTYSKPQRKQYFIKNLAS